MAEDRRLTNPEKVNAGTAQNTIFTLFKQQPIPQEATTTEKESSSLALPPSVTKKVTNSNTGSTPPAPATLSVPQNTTTPVSVPAPQVKQSSTPFMGSKLSGNTKTADELLKEGKFTATPNILNSYEQPSYQWTFYVGPDMQRGTAASGIKSGEQDKSKVIIAQTGLTSFNIQSIEFDSYVSPNNNTFSQSATTFRIKIVEPFGASLPDKMFLAAQYLKVKNYLKCPYYLSLTFSGYDPETGAPKQNIAEKIWTWQIMICSLKSSFDEVGCTHILEAVSYPDLANQNQYNVIPIPINVDVSDGEQTIGEVMQKLQDDINENIKKRYKGSPAPYTVKITDEPYSSTANSSVPRPFKHKIVRDTKHLDSSRNQSKLQVSKGTDIGKVFEYLISSSETGVSLANPSGGGSDSSVSKENNNKPMSVVHKIDTEVNIVGFDEIRREYIREFVFIIRGYDNLRVVLSPSMQDQANQKAKEKLNHAVKRYLLNKEYNYLYTGKNTEVLNTDIELNFMFNIAANFYEGHIFTEMASPGIQFDPDTYNKQKQQTNWNETVQGNIKSGSVKNSGNSGTTLAENLSNDDVNNFPISFIQDPSDSSVLVKQGVETNNTRGRNIYGMILNQLYGAMDSNLLNLNLEIKGDPYWLGYDNTSDLGKKNGESDEKLPNFLNGEHMFLLRFFIPRGINEETGDPDFDVSDMYSGFYGVVKVMHTFDSGMFKQTLNSVRITTMEGSELLK